MIQRTLEQICSMIDDAELRTPIQALKVVGVSTDTRTIKDGNLFVSLIGSHYDGHEYALQAYEDGAVAIVWQRDHDPATIPVEIPLILVDNTLEALQQLAAAYRNQLSVRVIGITGSNGKTSTKDMVASVMATQFRVHKTRGNLNNHIGLPQTLLQMDEATEIAVVEMGMSGRGEIELLSKIALPDAVIITNVGEAHMLQLGTREEIANAKFEIIAGLRSDGVLIYLGDEPLLQQLVEENDQQGAQIITFGLDAEVNDYYPSEIHVQADRTNFAVNVNVKGNSSPLTKLAIPLLGRHNVINALAAIAVAQWFGLNEVLIRSGLQQTVPTGMRIELLHASNGLSILNDAYNASPASMKAAIQLLDELQGYRHKIVVLGDMLELGPQSESYHRDIGKLLNSLSFSYIFTFGEMASYIADECRAMYSLNRVVATNDKADLIKQVAAVAMPQDIVLVKASRGKRLEELVEALMSG